MADREPMRVEVALGSTISKDYDSIRVDIRVSDSRKEGESAAAAFNRVYKFVDDRLTLKTNEAAQTLYGNV